MSDNNLITQFCWDNFDWNEETPSGAVTAHSMHGINIQEIKEGPYIPQTVPEMDKTTTKTKKEIYFFCSEQFEPCFVKSRVEPYTWTYVIITSSINRIHLKVEFSDFIWMLSRIEINRDCQSIPI